MKYKRPSKADRSAIAGIAGVVVAIALAGLLLLPKAGQPSGGHLAESKQVAGGDQPCHAQGTKTSLSALAGRDLPFAVAMPNDELASSDNVSAVWECDGPAIDLVFSSGISVIEDTNVFPDAKSAWEAIAAQDPSYTSVGTALDQPALLIDPMKAPAPINGSVTVILGDKRIVVEGNGKLSLDELLVVMNSLSAQK